MVNTNPISTRKAHGLPRSKPRFVREATNIQVTREQLARIISALEYQYDSVDEEEHKKNKVIAHYLRGKQI